MKMIMLNLAHIELKSCITSRSSIVAGRGVTAVIARRKLGVRGDLDFAPLRYMCMRLYFAE